VFTEAAAHTFAAGRPIGGLPPGSKSAAGVCPEHVKTQPTASVIPGSTPAQAQSHSLPGVNIHIRQSAALP